MPLTSQNQDQAHHFSRSHSQTKAGLPGMSEGVSYACLAIYGPASKCLVSSLWRISTSATFSSKVTNTPEQQRTSVTEKRTGALRQGWTGATHILTYVILPLWSSHVSATVGRCGSLASCSQTHHPIPALPQAQRFTFSSVSKSILLILALKLRSLQQATTLGSLLRSLQADLKPCFENCLPSSALRTHHSPFHLAPGLPLHSGSSSRF